MRGNVLNFQMTALSTRLNKKSPQVLSKKDIFLSIFCQIQDQFRYDNGITDSFIFFQISYKWFYQVSSSSSEVRTSTLDSLLPEFWCRLLCRIGLIPFWLLLGRFFKSFSVISGKFKTFRAALLT